MYLKLSSVQSRYGPVTLNQFEERSKKIMQRDEDGLERAILSFTTTQHSLK